MAKSTTIFACQTCGAQAPRWLGQCPECGTWNSYIEEIHNRKPHSVSIGKAKTKPVPLPELAVEPRQRFLSGIPEIDRVLGGGIVTGSIILLGGTPGIGKSTLLSQVSHHCGQSVLYVSAEESLQQIKMRADRLGLSSKNIHLFAETNLDAILSAVALQNPTLLIIDSIQTIASDTSNSSAGSVSQVRECATLLASYAKERGVAVMLVGHSTKDNLVAGPRTLEHLVDVVLTLEGEPETDVRLLRSSKNRFGTTFELGIFHMTDRGMITVEDPSTVFLRHATNPVPGSSIVCITEGTRPLLIEVQALTTRTAFGLPRRTTTGLDVARLHLLTAVLTRQCGIELGDQDIFVNITGGLSIKEPALDAAVCMSILTSFRNIPTPPKSIFFGEIGLLGEVRAVSRTQERLLEIRSRGYKEVYCPPYQGSDLPKGIKLHPIRHIRELAEIVS